MRIERKSVRFGIRRSLTHASARRLLESGPMARVAASVLLVLALGATARTASADPALLGSWSAAVDIHVVGVHATLLRTGDVLLFAYPRTEHGTEACLWSS